MLIADDTIYDYYIGPVIITGLPPITYQPNTESPVPIGQYLYNKLVEKKSDSESKPLPDSIVEVLNQVPVENKKKNKKAAKKKAATESAQSQT